MAQAKLTPVAKILIGLIILGGAGAAIWKLGVKDAVAPGAATTTPGGAPVEANGDGTGALGSATNPLKVSIVSFHGYAPALLANGNSLRTQPGSIYERAGVNVEFVIQDNIPTLTEIFNAHTAHCAWRTSDFWAQEQPNLRNNNLDGRAVMIVDNTQGGDAVIARDPNIRRIEDLAGKRVALLQYTPSHGMFIDAVENSSLSARQRSQLLSSLVFIQADGGTAAVRAAFESGNVDAAVLWDPDLALALRAVRGSHVVYSTAIATNLIYDVMVCDQSVLSGNADPVQRFVAGWLQGVDAAKANPQSALDALVATEEFFEVLTREHGAEFVKSLFSNVKWTNLEDNVRVLGLAGGTNYYENVYHRFDRIYREAGALANPSSPVINPRDSFDYRFVRTLMAAAPQVTAAAQQPVETFTETERAQVVEQTPSVTRPVEVNFASGEFELTRRAQQMVDQEIVPLVESHGSAYFEVSGNTDSTGTRAVNQRLSLQRAQAVVDYLVAQWEFPRERFQVVGNGSSEPLCNETSPDEGMSLEECRARNRATRVAVLARSAE